MDISRSECLGNYITLYNTVIIITGPAVSPAHTPELTLTSGGRRRSAQPWHRTCETGQPEHEREKRYDGSMEA